MKRSNIPVLLLFVFLAVQGPKAVPADEVVLTTGERFTTSRVWEEGDKIRFNMQGLLVSVDKAEVASIIRNDASPAPKSAVPDVAKPSLPSTPTGKTLADPTIKPLTRPTNRNETTATPSPASPKGEFNGVGVEGMTWRMPPGQLPGLKKVETDPAFGGIDQYYMPDQPLKFAGAPLDGLVYGFWQDQLYSIMMWVNGRVGYDRLRRGVFSIYGHGIQRKPEVERYVWDEKLTQRMLEFDDQLKTGIFIMRSSTLDALIKERYPSTASR